MTDEAAKPRARRCPKCGLVNPAAATRCDCGRSFVDGTMGAPLALPDKRERISRLRMVGVALVIAGVMLVVYAVNVHRDFDVHGTLPVGVGVVGVGVSLIARDVLRTNRPREDADD